jgi:putative aminopeptidase FrvX
MIDGSIVAAIVEMLDAYPGLGDRLAEEVTLERAHRYLSALEATPAPSQTVRWTRAPVITRLLREEGLLATPGLTWDENIAGTGNAALSLGRDPARKRVWILAHLDQISYLVDPGDGSRYPLVPLCYHMQEEGRRPGVALAHDLTRGTLVVRARGAIEVARAAITFQVEEGGPLEPGTRVVYDSQLDWDTATNRVRGYLDDSLACVAAMLAVRVLRHYAVDVLVGLTDEEEGPPGDANQSFGRGGRRLLTVFDRPELAIVSDVHESAAMTDGREPNNLRPGDGAVFVERSSNGRGGVTPPHLYALQRHLAAAVRQRGIRLHENWGGYVPRSEDINAVAVTPNVALLGVLCSNRHYARDLPAANLADIVDLAGAIVAYTLLVHSALWRDLTGSSGRSAPALMATRP